MTNKGKEVASEIMPMFKKVFYGWWIVSAAAVLHFIGGGTFYYGFTTFFNPIRQTFGWTAAATAGAFALQRLEAGILGPAAGYLVDKLGPRKLMVSGWAVTGLGFFLMSRTDSLWTFYGSFLVIAIGTSFAFGVVTMATIANWFARKRSRAMALLYIGPGLCGVLAPLLVLSIGRFGWRDALVIVSIGLWGIGIPLSLLMRHKPGQYGYLPDGETTRVQPSLHLSREVVRRGPDPPVTESSVKEALKTRAFWLLSFVFFFQNIGTSAVMVHLVPYLESVQIPTTLAAMAVTGVTLVSLVGRLGFGFLGDFWSKRYLIVIALTLQATGLFVFSLIDAGKEWLLVLFLLTYGPGYGGPIPLRPALQADYFGTGNFGTIMGLMSLMTMIGGLASPVFAGWVFDATGSYRWAWQMLALVTVPAIPLMLLAKPRRVERPLSA